MKIGTTTPNPRGLTLAVALLALTPFPDAFGQEMPASAARLEFTGPAVEIPMPQRNGRSIVQVRVGDSGPYDFLIDTGASISVIDTRIAEALGLEATGQVAAGAPGGESVDADLVSVPELELDALRILDVLAVALDIEEMTGGLMQGVLGLDLFGEVLLTLEPAAERAIVARGELPEEGPGVVALEGENGRVQFSMEVAGKTVATQIDSGSPGGFTLPIEWIDSIQTVDQSEKTATAGLVGGSRTIRLRRLDGVIRLAGLEFQNPEVGFMDPSPGTAHIGAQVLQDLVLTLDLHNRRLLLRPAPASPVAPTPSVRTTSAASSTSDSSPRRLGVGFQGRGGTAFSRVASVEPGSLGAQMGFEAGDELLTLNGRPMADYDMSSLGELIRGDEALTWEIERAGERLRIEVPGR